MNSSSRASRKSSQEEGKEESERASGENPTVNGKALTKIESHAVSHTLQGGEEGSTFSSGAMWVNTHCVPSPISKNCKDATSVPRTFTPETMYQAGN